MKDADEGETDMKPHLVMPMGGSGSRFYKRGYMLPKPLIEINGKPFLYWSTQSINKFIEIHDVTFVVLKEHIENNGIDKVIKQYYPEARIIMISEVFSGPVLTCLEGIEGFDDDAPVIFNDCDHMFKCGAFNDLMNKGKMKEDGILLTFEACGPQFSYVRYHDGKVIGTVEKEVVSSHAICGSYVFRNAGIFKSAAEEYMRICEYSEYFVSGVYNVLCNNRQPVSDYLLDFHVEFGTPEEFKRAKDSKYFAEMEYGLDEGIYDTN